MVLLLFLLLLFYSISTNQSPLYRFINPFYDSSFSNSPFLVRLAPLILKRMGFARGTLWEIGKAAASFQ